MSVIDTHIPIILASSSAIRQQMLKSVGVTFQVIPSGFDESSLKASMTGISIDAQALALAKAKALAVSHAHPDSLTIGADQICALSADKILEKPGSYEAAHAQLRMLSGKTHTQHCGLVIAKGAQVIFRLNCNATLSMRPLSEADIKAYTAADAPLHSCGSYKFESLGRHLFTHTTGDHDVIKGLPLTALLAELHRLEAIGFSKEPA
jgi:septum formation protein